LNRFPKDPLRFIIWVLQRSGNNKLLNKTVDDVYTSFVMCDKHFDPCYKSFGLQRLNNNAVPTLNLPGKNTFFFFILHSIFRLAHNQLSHSLVPVIVHEFSPLSPLQWSNLFIYQLNKYETESLLENKYLGWVEQLKIQIMYRLQN